MLDLARIAALALALIVALVLLPVPWWLKLLCAAVALGCAGIVGALLWRS